MVTITIQRSFYPSNRCKIALINIGTWRAHNMYVIVCTLSTYRKKWWNPHRVTQYYNNPIYVKVSLPLIGQNCVTTEAALQSYSQEKVFRKYAANLQENTHAEVWFHWSCTSVRVFSCKFAAYFQKTFFYKFVCGRLLLWLKYSK